MITGPMNASALPRPAPRLTGRRVLAIFALFFGTIATADAVLVTSALKTWSGLDDPSPYQASQRYNAELRRARAQTARGWRLDAAVLREGQGGAALTIGLRDADAQPLAGRVLRARLERPTDKRADRPFTLTQTAPGTYAGHLADAAPGQWELVVEVVDGDGVALRRKQRLVLD
jgi:nitrogen fixation protein FixH